MSNRVCAAQLLMLALIIVLPHTTRAATDRIFWNDFDPGISAPLETWTWVPVAGTKCGDGSDTGIGVNLTNASNRVLIYLEGGGACWNYTTCYIANTATFFTTGYGASEFAAESTDVGYLAEPGGFFDRTDTTNPFADYSYIFVPYCTGDVHAGDNVVDLSFLGTTKTAYFVGHRNLADDLKRLVDTFPAASRIVLAGSSAGGFGATADWSLAAESFPQVRVDLINDSGAIMPNDVFNSTATSREASWRSAWNLAATIPAGCVDCATDFDALYAYDSMTFPESRGTLLSYEQDSILPSFYGISTSDFTTGLLETEQDFFDPSANLRYFNVATSGHELWFSPDLMVNGVTVREFITSMVTDDTNWASVTPP